MTTLLLGRAQGSRSFRTSTNKAELLGGRPSGRVATADRVAAHVRKRTRISIGGQIAEGLMVRAEGLMLARPPPWYWASERSSPAMVRRSNGYCIAVTRAEREESRWSTGRSGVETR